jgi:hypothetical protein
VAPEPGNVVETAGTASAQWLFATKRVKATTKRTACVPNCHRYGLRDFRRVLGYHRHQPILHTALNASAFANRTDISDSTPGPLDQHFGRCARLLR